jgi:hypothetical protein
MTIAAECVLVCAMRDAYAMCDAYAMRAMEKDRRAKMEHIKLGTRALLAILKTIILRKACRKRLPTLCEYIDHLHAREK